MTKRIYSAKEGAQISEGDAQQYGDRLHELKEKTGYITPNIVLDDARKPTSPLHDYFEWDNTEAAKQYRLMQANKLIRSITVTIVNDGKEQVVREYYTVKSEPILELEEPRMYVSLETVRSDVDKREEVIAYALRELKGWKERYSIYSELDEMTRYIDEFVAKRKK